MLTMIAEISIDHDQKVIMRSLSGAVDPKQVLLLISEIAFTVAQYKSYHILVDIRDTTFEPEMSDLLEIATEFSRQLTNYNRKIAFLIPDTAQRRKVAEFFKACMQTQGFEFNPFFDHESATEWLAFDKST